MKAAPLAVLCTAQLMVLLDGTIMNIAVPAVARDLGLAPGSAQWLMTGYYLAFGGLLLLGGRVGDLLGRRAVFLAGIAVFTAASLAGGFAPTGAALIAARVVQGLGAAAAAPSILGLIHTAYTEPGPRMRALAAYTAMSSVGAATGLIAGGLLTQYLSWRWVLLVNAPLGAAVLLLGARLLPSPPRGRARLDVPGAVTITAAMSLLVYALSRAESARWTSPPVVAALAGAAVLLAAFAVLERRAPAPLLPPRLLHAGSRLTALAAAATVGATFFVLFYFGSRYLQLVLHAGPAKAGLQYVPFSATLLLTSQLVARARLRPHRAMPVGAAAATAAMLWLSRLGPAGSYPRDVLPPLLLCAIGLGLLIVPMTVLGMRDVPPADAGVAAGLLNTCQQLGGALGLAAATSVSGHGVGAPFVLAAGALAPTALLTMLFARPRDPAPAGVAAPPVAAPAAR